MKKFIIVLLSIISLFAMAGNDQMIQNNAVRIQKLEKLLQEKKFIPAEELYYSGAPSEEIRSICEDAMNIVVKALIDIPETGITQSQFWSLLEKAAHIYKKFDSDEMDRGLTYMEQIMDIYDIESSDGRLNNWRYGFEPSQSL